MENVGRTLFRLCGALLLAAGATSIDRPRSTDKADTAKPVSAVQPRFRREQALAGIQTRITPGKRAMAIRIEDVAPGTVGLIQPNSRVDILVTLRTNSKDGELAVKRNVAKLFMENVRVLAIGAVARRSQDGRPVNAAVATIEVWPKEAEGLAVAMSQGTIQLRLR